MKLIVALIMLLSSPSLAMECKVSAPQKNFVVNGVSVVDTRAGAKVDFYGEHGLSKSLVLNFEQDAEFGAKECNKFLADKMCQEFIMVTGHEIVS